MADDSGGLSYYDTSSFQPYTGAVYGDSNLETAGSGPFAYGNIGGNSTAIRGYDPSAYSSPQLNYLDNLNPQGYSNGLAGMVTKLGIDPSKVISGLQAYNGMSPDNNFNRYLASPYALLDAAQQGDPSLSGAISPFLAQNKGLEDRGQAFQAYQQQASNPRESDVGTDYAMYAAAMLGPAMLAVAAPAAAGLAAAEGGGAAATVGGLGAAGAGAAGGFAGGGTLAAGGAAGAVTGLGAAGAGGAADTLAALGAGAGAGAGAGLSSEGGETGAFDVSGSSGTGLPGTGPASSPSFADTGAPITDSSSSIPGTNNNPPSAGQLGDGTSGTATQPAGSNLSQLLSKIQSGNFTSTDLMSLLKGGLGGGGPISTIGNLASSLYGIYNSQQQKKLAQQAAANADPQGPYRAGYAQQLSSLMQNPGSVTGLPGYQAGLDAVMRSQAANGYLGSGNMMAALSQYGQNAYQNQVNTLSGLAGGNPGTAAQLSLQGNAAGNATLSNALAALGYGTRLLGV